MSRGAPIISLDGRIEEVLKTVGYMPSALIGALGSRNRDFTDHHKRKTLKSYLRFQGGDRARRMIASRMFGYGSKRNPERIADVQGESFLASKSEVGQLTAESILAFEQGATVTTGEAMAIPIGRGRPFTGVFANRAIWTGKRGGKSKLNPRDFKLIKNDEGQTLIIDARAKSIRSAAKKGHGGLIIVGILARRRHQPKRLGFMQAATAIIPKHLAHMESDIDKAMTAAGRASLEAANAIMSRRRQAFARVYREFLDANPRKFAKARAVARAASRAVKADPAGGGA